MAVTVADVGREAREYTDRLASIRGQISGNEDLFVALSLLVAGGMAVAQTATDENPKVVAVAMTLVLGASKLMVAQEAKYSVAQFEKMLADTAAGDDE